MRINEFYAPRIRAVFPYAELNRFCARVYTPKIGARGIPGKIKAIEGFIVDQQLQEAGFAGRMNVVFDDDTASLKVAWDDDPR